MKFVILHGEGLADRAYPELGGKTPLQAAATPNMDALVRAGEVGIMAVPSDGPAEGQEAMALGVLGYDPRKYPVGPAPFETAGLGVALGDQDVAFRCSMVTLKLPAPPGAQKGGSPYPEMKKLNPQAVMDDDSAGAITTEEARDLIEAVNEQIGSESVQFYPGEGHRHFMIWVGGKAKAQCADPHELVGHPIGTYLPRGDGGDILRKMMEAALIIVETHPVNDQRLDAGLKPANCLWLWGQGRAPKLPTLADRFHLTGTVLATSDLVRGVCVSAGLETVGPEEFSKNGEADFTSQAQRALKELEKKDLLYVHAAVSHAEGQPKAKCDAAAAFDQNMVGVLVDGLKKIGEYRLLLVGERWMPTGKPARPVTPALYAFVQSSARGKDKARGFNEADAEAAQSGARDATKLLARLLGGR